MMLDQSGAAFDPVAVIGIEDAVDIAHFRVVDMAANNAVGTVFPSVVGDGIFELSDVRHCIFDLYFR